MIIKVLGSAAGGGFPQWNCNCRNCADVRRGVGGLVPRTQSSLAVSADGLSWMLVDASPDLRQQIAATPELDPQTDGRSRASPITAVVLTSADVDHVAGLLSLRESQPFSIHADPRVLSALAASSIFGVLGGCVRRLPIPRNEVFEPEGCAGLGIEAFAVPGKVALYLEDEGAGPGLGTALGDVIGLKVIDGLSGRFACYVPGCAAVDGGLLRQLAGAAAVLFDGTLYRDDEMIAQGLSQKTGRRMGHISMSGVDGSVAALAGLDAGRRIFTHVNNSNPALREGSPEREWVEAAGWEIAHDGMEVVIR
ncbi:MAG: pyrroloquinoline quinone biosynthesis protein PqqB [Hyphomicrobiaceae bacterium]|nr:pyrroloquinoline quinone biosynthesis protein PqqB [Hyphomicrobiaceae bacterium]